MDPARELRFLDLPLTTPVGGTLERSAPDPLAPPPGLCFSDEISAVGNSHTRSNQKRPQIILTTPADYQQSVIAISMRSATLPSTSRHQAPKRPSRFFPTGIGYPIRRLAALPQFRCIETVDAEPLAISAQRIPVDHPKRPTKPLRLLVFEFGDNQQRQRHHGETDRQIAQTPQPLGHIPTHFANESFSHMANKSFPDRIFLRIGR